MTKVVITLSVLSSLVLGCYLEHAAEPCAADGGEDLLKPESGALEGRRVAPSEIGAVVPPDDNCEEVTVPQYGCLTGSVCEADPRACGQDFCDTPQVYCIAPGSPFSRNPAPRP